MGNAMDFKRKDNESEEQFLWRIGMAKDKGLLDASWKDIADAINKEFRDDESEYMAEAAYRKPYQQAKRFYEAGVFSDKSDDSYIRELRNAKHELRKEKQKLYDERSALNKTLREQGRVDHMYDVVKRVIDDYQPIRFEYHPKEAVQSDNDLIIHLTDVHCGVNIDSPLNVFNDSVLIKRIHEYLDRIMEIRNMYGSEAAYVILGGDMIHGLIHTNARIESKENIIEQIMIVSDIVSHFLYELSKVFTRVEVHTTAGNHGRAMQDKDWAVRGENFDLLVPYVCSKDLKNVDNIVFVKNQLDADIATFSVRGHMVYATHGDKDTARNVVYHMTQFARKAYLALPDICYLGHRHTNGLTTVDGVKVIESGCIDGMDAFAIEQRLTGYPEQTVTVITQEDGIKALLDIQLH